jgi:neurotransmitter:Na+ symporter, NSS family
MMGRERWSSRTIFLFAAIGSAVGLGNIWRFPYLTYKFGGGAFLIPYLLALLVIGIPLLILEFALGQKLQKGAVGAFKSISPKLRGIGVAAILAGFIVVIYYAAVMAWSLMFAVNSIGSPLPWAADSEGFFFNDILGISSGPGDVGGIQWPLFISLAAVWVAIYFCVRKGVKSVGKVVAWTMPLPIIFLVILFFRGITLPGALSGIGYYLRPDFTALLSTEIWIAAISQIFFTLSLAFGIMIAYSSFNKEDQDVRSDSYTTAFVNSAISLFAGFVVFAVLGYMAGVQGVTVDDVAASGPGLAFVVFPQALSLMPLAPLFAFLFFVMLLTLGIDSAFSLVEAVNTSIGDTYARPNRKRIAFWVCLVAFLGGIIFTTGAGLYFLDIVDHFVTNYALVYVGIFEAIAIGWVYGIGNLGGFVNKVSKKKVGKAWEFSIKYLIPVILVFLLISQLLKDIRVPYEGYPAWALGIGWGAAILPLIFILVYLFGSKK